MYSWGVAILRTNPPIARSVSTYRRTNRPRVVYSAKQWLPNCAREWDEKWCLRKSGGDEKVVETKKVVFVVRQCAWCTILFFVGKCEMFHCFLFFRREMLPGLVKDVAAWDLVDRQSFLQLFHAGRHVQFPVHSCKKEEQKRRKTRK